MERHEIGTGICEMCDASGVVFAHPVKVQLLCEDCLGEVESAVRE